MNPEGPLPPKPLHYNLDHEPIDITTSEGLEELVQVSHSPKRQIGYDEIDGVGISTVFMISDMSLGMSDTPVLYETAVFGKGIQVEGGFSLRVVRRYATREEAEAGHAQIAESWRRVSADLQQQEQLNHERME